MTNEELERAVERVRTDVAHWPFMPEAASIGPRRPQDMADDLRALLSERAELLAAVERMRAMLNGIKWRSIDRDNMEFSATITCWQMDAIRAALTTGEGK